MANFVQDGKYIDYVNRGADGIKRGDPVVLSESVVIAETDIPAGGKGVLALCGVYEFPSAAEAIAVGDAVYWDATAGNITKTSTSNKKAGMAVSAQTAAAGKVLVKIG